MDEQALPAAGRRSRTRLVVQGVLSLILMVAAIFYVLRQKFDPADWHGSIGDRAVDKGYNIDG